MRAPYGACASSLLMASNTARVLARTSWFQKRMTRNPCSLRYAVRRASGSACSACCPPSISAIRRASTQQKWAQEGPTGCCLRNFAPASWRPRKGRHRAASALLPSRRRARDRVRVHFVRGSFFTECPCGKTFRMGACQWSSSERNPSPRPSPRKKMRGEGERPPVSSARICG